MSTLVITGVWWVFQSNSKTDPSKNENFYEHEKCWTILDRVCLKVGLTCCENTRLFWGEIIVFFCKFERKKYTFLSKLFWPFANFRPSSENKGIPDLLESVFFGLKYLSHICEMDLNKPVQWTYGRDTKKNSYQSGNGVNRNVGWLLTLPLFHILNEPLGDLYI